MFASKRLAFLKLAATLHACEAAQRLPHLLPQGGNPQACLVNTLQEQAYVYACQAQMLSQAAVVHPELPMIPDWWGAATICRAHAPLAEQGLLCLQASMGGFRCKAASTGCRHGTAVRQAQGLLRSRDSSACKH